MLYLSNKITRRLAIATIALLLLAEAGAQVSINQVDPSALLPKQVVDVYLSVAGADGNAVGGLGAENFSLSEGASERKLAPVAGFELKEGISASEGITFYLLVDNSGSMYDRIDGTPTGVDAETRMAAVSRAVSSFLNSIDNPKDLVGLGSFNTNYAEGVRLTAVRSETEASFAKIGRPTKDESYTELFAALAGSAGTLKGRSGRKVVILLSDGENYPYASHSGKPHPAYGTDIATSGAAIKAMIKEGVSVFAVHFGPAAPDSELRAITAETGGLVFDAKSEQELSAVYQDIRRRVLREYRLRYRPGMMEGDKRFVKVEYRGPSGASSATQYYFTGTIFGRSAGPLSLWLLVPFLLALAAWFGLTKLRFLNKRSVANLEVLEGGATQVFSLSDGKTVIGSASGQLTIARDDGKAARGADDVTIVKDARTGIFTLVSPKTVYVNNRPTESRRLAAGDVIRIGEATIVFDEAAELAAKQAKPAKPAKGPTPEKKK